VSLLFRAAANTLNFQSVGSDFVKNLTKKFQKSIDKLKNMMYNKYELKERRFLK
jgi:hypothetical protein